MAKDSTIIFRCTNKEKNYIKSKCDDEGYKSESECIRQMLMQDIRIDRTTFEEVHKAIYELNAIGKNINQIVHRNNMQIYSKDDIDKLIRLLDKCNDSLLNIQITIDERYK